MDCRSTRRTLPALLDGDLRRSQEQEIRGHLETCADCTESFAEITEFLELADDALTYQGAPLSFASLRARMAAIEPLEQVLRYQLPRLQIPGAAPRFAVAMMLLAVLAGIPYAVRHTRVVYTSVKSPFMQQEAILLAALEEGRFPGDTPPEAAREEGDDRA